MLTLRNENSCFPEPFLCADLDGNGFDRCMPHAPG